MRLKIIVYTDFFFFYSTRNNYEFKKKSTFSLKITDIAVI